MGKHLRGVLLFCCLVGVQAPVVNAAPFAGVADMKAEALLPTPPVAGSAAEKADLAEVLRTQHEAGAARFAASAADGKVKSVAAFAPVIGPGFDLKKLPATVRLFDDIRDTEKRIVSDGKDHFRRPRPWVADPAITPCNRGDEPMASYPSGHATMAYSMGVVLAALIPARREAILARAADYAEARVICAVHYRGDIIAGQVLGTAIAVRLQEDTVFASEFAAAKAELAAAHISTP